MRITRDQRREIWRSLTSQGRNADRDRVQPVEIHAQSHGRLAKSLGPPQRIGWVGCTDRECFGPNHAQTLP